MIKNIDLDVRNYQKKYMDDGEAIIYLRLDEPDISTVVDGDVADLINMLFSCDDLHDVILNVAVHIVKEQNLNFDEIYENITKE